MDDRLNEYDALILVVVDESSKLIENKIMIHEEKNFHLFICFFFSFSLINRYLSR